MEMPLILLDKPPIFRLLEPIVKAPMSGSTTAFAFSSGTQLLVMMEPAATDQTICEKNFRRLTSSLFKLLTDKAVDDVATAAAADDDDCVLVVVVVVVNVVALG